METILKVYIVMLITLGITSCDNTMKNSHEGEGSAKGHSGHDHHEEEKARGKNGGTLLSKDNFAIELKIFEVGTAPRFRVYAYEDGKVLNPTQFDIEVTTKRLAQKTNIYTFIKTDGYYFSNEEVVEPHSFTINVNAKYKDKDYNWHYDSFEGRTIIPDDVAKISGIETESAVSRKIGDVIKIRGNILPSEHKIAHIVPRFSGIVREGKKHIGDKTEKGEALAIIESNQSLQPFQVISQISGTVINGHLIPGEFVPENQWVYIVADISEVWGDFYVPISQIHLVKIDQKIQISTLDKNISTEAVISYVAPYIDENSQSQMVRVIIENEKNSFLPGMFVIGKITTALASENISVRKSAIQNFNGQKSVFIKSGEIYEVRPIEIGKSDDEWVEVLSGLTEGDEYVHENSFLIKADILKSGASHDH